MAPSHASRAATSAAARARVLLPLPLDGPYDYGVPPHLSADPGAYVEVPLGPRRLLGVVWDPQTVAAPTARFDSARRGSKVVPDARLRPIATRFDVPPMPATMRRFVDWVAAYTLSADGAVLRMALGPPDALAPPRPRIVYARVADPVPVGLKITNARRRVLDAVDAGPPRTAAELAEAARCGAQVIRGLVEAGVLTPRAMAAEDGVVAPDWRRPGPALSADQRSAAEALRASLGRSGFSVTLLDGVTGSGKTEVYFEAIAAALAVGRQVLVLLPEIALTGQWLDRFVERFGTRPVEWHSDVQGAQRRAAWRSVAAGTARLVVGARSALFLPFSELGLIIIDEEHDGAFKQEDGVIYHARDMAVVRARLEGIPIVLVSATPSLETIANVEAGRYGRLVLPARHGGASVPQPEAIDLRRDPPPRGRWLSPRLVSEVTRTLAAGEQAMLFLNRRGYAPLTLCRACGFRLQCPNCTAWLVEHRLTRRLHCHHCDHHEPIPDLCPSCAADDSLVPCGPGVERIHEEVRLLFPAARTAIMASDTLGGPKALRAIVEDVQEGRLDLLVGTQVMAKGHHFPNLTLVGVVDADLGLSGGDLRAAERTWQLLQQVAGRAGRAERPGRAFLQTHMPEHPVMQALIAGDRDGFLAREAEERRSAGLPPYGRLAALIVSGEDEFQVETIASELGRQAPRDAAATVLGPARAPLALLRGRHRRRLLLKVPRTVPVQPLLTAWLERVEVPNAVRVQVDVDPYSFM